MSAQAAIEESAVSNFPEFGEAVHRRYTEMATGELYVVDTVDIFESYLAAFPEGTNRMFRTRTEFDCSCCKNFVRNLGRLVSIENGQVKTVWDIEGLSYPFDVVAQRMGEIIRQAPIVSVFRTKERSFGTEFSYDSETRVRWNHFHGRVNNRHHSSAPDTIRGKLSTDVKVFARGLRELSADAFDTVLDLIDSNAIYRGAEFRNQVVAFRTLKQNYDASQNRDAFAWENVTNPVATFRNTAIGSLLTDISDGVPLEDAVRMFEGKVAPQNYKRPTALITSKMIDSAVEKLRELGLEDAVKRRFARTEDMSVTNVLFVNGAVQEKMRDGLAGLLMEEVKPTTAVVKNPTPISAEEFFSRVVPQATSISAFVQNSHMGNFVSLTAPKEANTGNLFKWKNDFAWSYDGEVTDSIKQRVKAAGGNVNAKLRVSLAWSNFDDLDIHSHGPDGHIYYGDKKGILDVDMNAFKGTSRTPVENLAWAHALRDGVYRISVNNFTKRENRDFGFSLEVECGGRVEQYRYDAAVSGHATVEALEITIRYGQIDTIKVMDRGLVGGSVSSQKWGIATETFVPVDMLMLSPNYWDGQEIGNKHWFFILKDCLNPDSARGIYNEFLRSSLDPHRKVFEVLGSKTKCEPSTDQLSGIGFSSTRKETLTVMVKGRKINGAFAISFA